MGGERAGASPPPQAGPAEPHLAPPSGTQTAPSSGPRLASPSQLFHGSFLAALAEYHREGRHRELERAGLADPDEFARYVRALLDDVAHPGAPDRYVLRAFGVRLEPPSDGHYVPQTVLWWVDGAEYLGRINVRHKLNRSLLWRGGNIGYEVRPSARRQGHATAMLAAALPVAASLGIHEARIDCDIDNVASRRVIEKNGGVFEREEHGSYFFLVPTS
jgi:GNAT superfamily N-acetyltransferase